MNYLNFHSEGTLHVADTAKFSNGCSINIGGNVHLGKNFTCNAGFVLSAENKVSIGDDCLFGWNVNILDGDGHDILIDKKKVNTSRPIHIGNHCWICSNVTILKGTFLENESVVGTGTIVSKSFENNGNVLISGNPARVSKNEIEWKA